jgi:GT2 family glycosyltransferase
VIESHQTRNERLVTSPPSVTIVVVPREQFSKARASLESIYAHTSAPFSLIYVDGASPPALAAHLRREAAAKDFQLIRTERYLPSNEARNLALPHSKTKYTVFIDNDVLVTPHWLEKLVACAEETEAWVVGPLYCVGEPEKEIIHTLGADLAIIDDGKQRRLHEHHHFCHRRVSAVSASLQRRPIDLVEFHCLLMRTDVVERIGWFDERLLSYFDHTDFCLAIRRAGGTIYAEPASIVGYLPPPPFAHFDVAFFLLRWSNRWLKASLAHFCQKYGLDPGDPVFRRHFEYQQAQRGRLLRHPRRIMRKLLRGPGLRAMEAIIDLVLDRTIVAYASRRP